jgi:hypothetical protein
LSQEAALHIEDVAAFAVTGMRIGTEISIAEISNFALRFFISSPSCRGLELRHL